MGTLKTDTITNQAGTGAPDFPNGASIGSDSLFAPAYAVMEDISNTGSQTVGTSVQFATTSASQNITISANKDVFTIQDAGVYHIHANVDSTTSDTNKFFRIRVNGTTNYNGQLLIAAGARPMEVSATLNLAANDTVEIQVGGVTQNLAASLENNRLGIFRVG